MPTPISPNWTAEERLRVVDAMLPSIQLDIHAGKYSHPGRLNITSVQHIIHSTAEELEQYREVIEAILDKVGR
jgi:hypothetical protein